MEDDLTWLVRNVHECLSYNRETGEFTWKERPLSHFADSASHKSWNTKHAGRAAGHRNNHEENKYVVIRIKGTSYGAHRLAILMCFGYIPDEVDHINGVQYDNRIANLSPCSRAENTKNLPRRKGRSITGISLDKGKFRVRINVEKLEIAIGNFEDFFEACCARKSAERRYGFSEFHGRNPSDSDAIDRNLEAARRDTAQLENEAITNGAGSTWFERGELPPIGVECEAFAEGVRAEKCKIIAYHKQQVAVQWRHFNDGGLDVLSLPGWSFRPIRTERDELMDIIRSTAHPLDDVDVRVAQATLADAILAAGFRRDGGAV